MSVSVSFEKKSESARSRQKGKSVSVSVSFEKKSESARSRSHSHSFLLTHLGSNQDSAEPKSVVLPITPWVNRTSKGAAKLEKFLIYYI